MRRPGPSSLLLAAVVTLGLSACRTGTPVVRPGAKVQENARGTLTGRLLGPDGTAIAGRRVVAVETSSGGRYEALTTGNGGFVFLIPSGDYRLVPELAPGEAVQRDPGVVHLGKGDIDSHREIVVAARAPGES
jgi:hypothetical protein